MVINLTPHPLYVYDDTTPEQGTELELAPGLLVTIPPAGRTARLRTHHMGFVDEVQVDGIPIDVEGVAYGAVEGLPDPVQGVWYVVPLVTALAARRPDLLIPHRQVRNERGTVVGCKSFGRIH